MGNLPKRRRQKNPTQMVPPKNLAAAQTELLITELLKAELTVRVISMKMAVGEFAQKQGGTLTPRSIAAWALHEMELAGEEREFVPAEDAIGRALEHIEAGEVSAEELAKNEARIFGKTEEDQEAAAMRARVEEKGLTIVGGTQ